MLRKLQEKKGFTLIELMIVVAILGILAAVAIPQYLDYIAATKRRSALSNFDSGTRFVSAEFKKEATGMADATTNALTELNSGGRTNPYLGEGNAAFITGVGVGTLGAVGLSATDLNGLTLGLSVSLDVNYLTEGGTQSVQTVSLRKE